MKVAQAIQEILLTYGINEIFGIAGREAAIIHFDETKIKFLLTRHENTAGVMAGAVTKYTDKPAACFVTVGPGTTHIMTGIATATQDRRPVLFIAAQIEKDDIHYNDAHQCIDTVSITKPLTKYSHEIMEIEDIYEVMFQAVNQTKTAPYGPSFLSVPIDILNSEIEFDLQKVIPLANQDYRVLTEETALNEAKEALKQAKKPIIIIGDACVKSEKYIDSMIAFAEAHNIPMMCTYASIGAVPYNHPLYYGVINSYEKSIIKYHSLDKIFEDVDVIILAGYDTVEHHPNTWKHGISKKCIAISSYKLDIQYRNTDQLIEVLGEIDELTDALDTVITDVVYETDEIIDTIRSKREKKKMETSEEGILIGNVIKVLEESLKEFIFASDVGLHRHLTSIFYPAQKREDYLTSYGLSAFGTGLALGLGAKYANPNRDVVVISGDGGFLSSCCDLETAKRLGLKLLVIIVNSRSYALIKRYLMEGGSDPANPDVVELDTVDFAKLADAMNCKGIRVKNEAELVEAIEQYKVGTDTVVLDVNIQYPKLYRSAASRFGKLLSK